LQTENQAIEIINGFLRPIWSASQSEAVAPTSRIHKGQGEDDGDLGQRHAEVLGDPHHQQLKSKASRVHPSQAATPASHSSLVGSSTMELELYWPLPLI
jgi:hypothetical protein